MRWELEFARFGAGVLLCLAASGLGSAIDARAERSDPPPVPAVAKGTAPVRYELDAVLDTSLHRIAATGVVRWTNTSRKAQRELWIHLYLNAFKNERTRFMRSPASLGFRGNDRLIRAGFIEVDKLHARELERDLWPSAERHSPEDPEDETDIRVPLEHEIAPGETLTLDVAFTAELPSILLRTGFSGSFHMVGQWFPKLARLEKDGSWAHFPFHRLSEFYADFADYDVTLDVPDNYTIGATGVPQGEPTYGTGRVRRRYTASAVIDFVFSAWDGFEQIRRMADQVEIVSLFPRGEARAAEIELETVTHGLAHFGERYGAYPYPRLTIVRPPRHAAEAGGMEYPMLITSGASERWRFVGVRSIEAITLHELAHQWFFGTIATNEYRWPFLDEGLATYAECEAMESRWPGASVASALGLDVGAPAALRAVAAEVQHRGPIARSASEFPTGRDYAGLVYARTATALSTIARVYGDNELRMALSRYAREQKFGHPDPSTLIEAVRSEVGDEPAERLRSALDGGWVDYSITHERSWPIVAPEGRSGGPNGSDRAGRAGTNGYRGLVGVRREGTLELPIEVEVVSLTGHKTRLGWDGRGDHAVLEWQGDSAIASVVIDPDSRVLLDGDLSNNTLARRRIGPRVLAFGAWLAQVGLGALWP